jgi:hypothetical protein
MSEAAFKVGLVGVCGSGKTTLTNGLKPYGFIVRQIAQEHSFVPDMWQRLVDPDVLIFLEVSYPITTQRKPFKWNEKDYNEQIRRLEHANLHADLHVSTDDLTPKQVLEMVLDFLSKITGENYLNENKI